MGRYLNKHNYANYLTPLMQICQFKNNLFVILLGKITLIYYLLIIIQQ
jgi:hypothetical protein